MAQVGLSVHSVLHHGVVLAQAARESKNASEHLLVSYSVQKSANL